MLNRAKWMSGISVVSVFVAAALSSTRATGAVATDGDALTNGAKDGGLSLMAAHDAGDFAAKDGGASLSFGELSNKDGGGATLLTFDNKDGGSATLLTFGNKDGGSATPEAFGAKDGGSATPQAFGGKDGGTLGTGKDAGY